MQTTRRQFMSEIAVGGLGLIAGYAVPSASAAPAVMEVYKSPHCGCCGAWVKHVRLGGFQVRITDVEDLEPIKKRFGVDPSLRSCHTALIAGYVIEGHVPAREIKRLLAQRPTATGLAVPGMPVGSPGMEQEGRQDGYEVILFSSNSRYVFARY